MIGRIKQLFSIILTLSAWSEYYARKGVVYISPTHYEAKSLSPAYKGNNRLIDLLIASGLDLAKEEHKNLLYLAFSNNDIRTIRSLVNQGMDIHWKPTNKSASLIEIAVSNGNREAVDILLYRGIKLESTLLHKAAKFGRKAVVNLLIGYGADLTLKDNILGKTALEFAQEFNHVDIVKLIIDFQNLEKNNLQIGNVFERAIANGHYDLIKRLLERGTKPPLEAIMWAKNHYDCNDKHEAKKAYQLVGMRLIKYLRFFNGIGSPSYPAISKSGVGKLDNGIELPLDIINFIARLSINDD